MQTAKQIAKHLKEVHFGGNWTVSSLKEHLEGVTWEQATTQVHQFNTIAKLVYHIHYYVAAALRVLNHEPLNSKDSESFNVPPIHSQQDWEKLLDQTWSDASALVAAIEQLPEYMIWDTFTDEKYGIYYRNLSGIIEHTHYHLGQIVLIKKLVAQSGN